MDSYVNQKFGISVTIEFENVILNNFLSDPRNILNTYGLILKQIIYRCKCQGEKIAFAKYLSEVKVIESYERYGARVTNKLEIHNVKWGNSRSETGNLNSYVSAYINRM